ncbi:carbohydrate-binding module family 1 protein [Ceratobasidium sp. AG-Ba]|nr:carbohydrate-binding module family 1 protein [Ceratobasidium sp. AG-Ba]
MRFTSVFSIVAAAMATTVLAQQVPNWGMCGGIGWTGPTTCNTGWVCQYWNDWDSTCIPDYYASSISQSATAKPTSTSKPAPTPTPPSPPPHPTHTPKPPPTPK